MESTQKAQPRLFEKATDSDEWQLCSYAIISSDRGLRGIKCTIALARLLFPKLQQVAFLGQTISWVENGQKAADILMAVRDYVELAGGKRFQSDDPFALCSDASSLFCSIFKPWAVACEEGWLDLGRIAPPICLFATLGGIGEPACAFAGRMVRLNPEESCPAKECRYTATEGLEASYQAVEGLLLEVVPSGELYLLGIISSTLSVTKEYEDYSASA